MDENSSENAIRCNLRLINRLGFKFAEENWCFGKYKINFLLLMGGLLLNFKCWFTVINEGLLPNSWSLKDFTFKINVSVGVTLATMKVILFVWKSKEIHELCQMLIHDLIVIDKMDKRLEKEQKFCMKIANFSFR